MSHMKQEKKRAAIQSPDGMLRSAPNLLLQWKQESECKNFEMSALDCLSMNEDKALKKARRKIKNKVRAV